ncbi:MAG TPA: protein-methionine-sulfoxide reductase heme-binding subunit MsrQ [Agitococcus sp.]|jgi:sulfoxide reductase heme-binding subunit YedZ|nr:sulfoxide reductase heme-binding subunit YedZ [Moraxellaceae bacterium]MBL0229277.1 sulfoxide reductase heme-binding subunit YedZ [Moraxellaceae bacterium]MCC6374083.1 sulfoxide reductase heme-binding subunit YedZ [Moraxellaceae bacterium]HQV80658.1 protein-methionine-sulfoxide reductase heme-binding subunit MsrQ [Agitococcus sp.]
MTPRQQWISRSKPFVFLTLLLPFIWLAYLASQNMLGADPAKKLVDETGLWAFRILLLSLSMTPLKNWTGSSVWIHYRRMTGLFAFFYVLLHLCIYVFLLFGAQWAFIGAELIKRPYIVVGFSAFLLLIPLAITSTKSWQKRLGKNWVKLHKLVYIISILGLVHLIWLKKLGIVAVWPYALILFILLSERIRLFWQKQRLKHSKMPN